MLRKYLCITGTLILFLTGCEEIMDLEFEGDETKTLVVEGMITTDTTAHKVMLSWTGDYFKKLPQDMATGATVTISDGDKTFNLTENQPGIYETSPDVYGEVGKSYTLRIRFQDSTEYSGTDKISYCTHLDTIAQTDNFDHGFFGIEIYGYNVLFSAQEPEPVGDNYIFLMYFNDSLCTDTLTKIGFISDEFFNGNYIDTLAIFFIGEDQFIGDSMKVTLEIQSINIEYYDYLTGLMLETVWRGSPWDGPPANVPSNMDNGARGYFRASDVNRKTKYFYPTPRRAKG
jgi:hypothetical protein